MFKKFKNTLKRILFLKVFLKDRNKKSIPNILIELFVFAWVKKEIPTDYFRKFLYRKEINNITEYLTLKQFYKIIYSEKIVFSEISSIINNKLSFSLLAERYQLPVPKLFSYNLRNYYYDNESVSIIGDMEGLKNYFKMIFNKTHTQHLFLKLITGQGGDGAILLKKENLDNLISLHHTILLQKSYIHQEVIQQHDDINKINSACVNTLRIDVYLDAQNKPHVLSALMRFGIGQSITDNTHTGGFYISINSNTGRLQGNGIQDIVEGGNTFKEHPDSKVPLEGFKVPFFQEACNLAKLASTYLPNRIIGWDIAISKDGPVIIEGNKTPSLHVTDVAYGGYCKHPKIKEILKELKT